jgi:hypothetical protein
MEKTQMQCVLLVLGNGHWYGQMVGGHDLGLTNCPALSDGVATWERFCHIIRKLCWLFALEDPHAWCSSMYWLQCIWKSFYSLCYRYINWPFFSYSKILTYWWWQSQKSVHNGRRWRLNSQRGFEAQQCQESGHVWHWSGLWHYLSLCPLMFLSPANLVIVFQLFSTQILEYTTRGESSQKSLI